MAIRYMRGILDKLYNPFTLDNAKALYYWPLKNKNITLPVITPAITFVASKAFFNLSYQTSAILSTAATIAYFVDKKYPNVKHVIVENISKVAKFLSEQNRIHEEQRQTKVVAQRLNRDQEHSTLMTSFLHMSQAKMLEDYNKENSNFILTCQYFDLSNILIRTLLNAYVRFPEDTEDHFQRRIREFIDLLPASVLENTKAFFQGKLKKVE